jgi:hypothetical protein
MEGGLRKSGGGRPSQARRLLQRARGRLQRDRCVEEKVCTQRDRWLQDRVSEMARSLLHIVHDLANKHCPKTGLCQLQFVEGKRPGSR